MLEYLDDRLQDGTTHGRNGCFSYVAGMFTIYGPDDIMDQDKIVRI